MKLRRFEDIKIYNLPKFTPEPKPRGRWIRQAVNKQVCAFDIETTKLEELQQSVMYVWQFAIEDFVIVGRTWEQFKQLVSWLNSVSHGRKIIVYVHNLSYEFQFLSGIFHFDNENVFPTDNRKVLKCNLENIEFRCSYLLTNLSLDAMTKRYGVKHQKLSGTEFDYTKIRFSDTPLTEREIEYCVNDVIGLVEAVHAIMELNGDNLYTIPLTATGFVREYCKNAMRPEHKQIVEAFPDYEVFQLLRQAFRGGNTHANRYAVDYVIKQPVTSMDITSSYPFQQVCKKFPVSPFEPVRSNDIHYIDKQIERGKAVIFQVELTEVKLRNKYEAMPYIPLDKCSIHEKTKLDNGRILSAARLVIAITDIDWNIIIRQYTFNAKLLQAYKSRYDFLPDGLVQSNIEFYKKKTELKGVKGQELFYMKNKELLNSIFGMSVQNPVKRSILLNDVGFTPDLYIEDQSLSDRDLLDRARKKAFTCYQFGVWTCAHARASLQAGIDICGEDILYCDTDSCKFIGQHDFTQYNKAVQQLSVSRGLYATDIKGVMHYGGVYELDGIYQEFITQGAKKYAYMENGALHLTLAGVSKRAGAAALQAAGGLAAFRDGFVFKHCGKTESIYNDIPCGQSLLVVFRGEIIEVTRNVVINDKDYTLSKTDGYNELINFSKKDISKIIAHLENLHAIEK